MTAPSPREPPRPEPCSRRTRRLRPAPRRIVGRRRFDRRAAHERIDGARNACARDRHLDVADPLVDGTNRKRNARTVVVHQVDLEIAEDRVQPGALHADQRRELRECRDPGGAEAAGRMRESLGDGGIGNRERSTALREFLESGLQRRIRELDRGRRFHRPPRFLRFAAVQLDRYRGQPVDSHLGRASCVPNGAERRARPAGRGTRISENARRSRSRPVERRRRRSTHPDPTATRGCRGRPAHPLGSAAPEGDRHASD